MPSLLRKLICRWKGHRWEWLWKTYEDEHHVPALGDARMCQRCYQEQAWLIDPRLTVWHHRGWRNVP
jgi:hypothetical protein